MDTDFMIEPARAYLNERPGLVDLFVTACDEMMQYRDHFTLYDALSNFLIKYQFQYGHIKPNIPKALYPDIVLAFIESHPKYENVLEH